MKKNMMKSLCLAAMLTFSWQANAEMIDGEDFETFGTKWGGAVGTGANVTYSFMATGTSCAAEFAGCSISHLEDFMPGGYKSEIESALAAWSAVADITFTEVADDGAAFNAATTSGDMRFGGHTFDGSGGVLAHGFFPPPNGITAAGDMHFDIDETWKIGFAGSGFDIFQIAAHEIGHAIGLEHTDVPNSLMNPFYTEAFSGPQADDIAGAVHLYGAPSAVPLPASVWFMLTAMLGLFGAKRNRSTAVAVAG